MTATISVRGRCAVLSSSATDPMVPGTLLKEHEDFHLFTDRDSTSLCSEELLGQYQPLYV